MEYLRDCKNTDDFKEHFLDPFIRIQVNDFKRKFIEDIITEFPDILLDKKLFNFIIKYENNN